MNTVQSQFSFSGFTSPNTTSVPDQAFDEIMPMVTPAQWKVLCYIIRRTYGFKKLSDTISLKQICSGITTKEGKVLDRGTGLSKSAVAEALNGYKDRSTKAIKFPGLLEMGIIVLRHNTSRLGDSDPNTYALHMQSEDPAAVSDNADGQTTGKSTAFQEEAEEINLDTALEEGGSPLNGQPLSVKQTTVVRLTDNIQTDSLQPDSFTNSDSPEREKEEKEGKRGKRQYAGPQSQDKTPPPHSAKAASAASSRTTSQTSSRTSSKTSSASTTSNALARSEGVTPIAAVLQGMLEEGVLKRASDASAPDPTKASGSPGRHPDEAKHGETTRSSVDLPNAPGNLSQPQIQSRLRPGIRSARISLLVKEICEEFHDPKIKSTTTQIHTIWWQTNYPEEIFEDWLRMLRSDVRQRQHEGTVRNPMGYFMQTLKNTLLRPLDHMDRVDRPANQP